MRVFTVVASAVVLFLASPALAQPSGPPQPRSKTVTVDCAAGDTIANALRTVADELVIEVTGFCAEYVTITRPVLMRGTNPLTDGVVAPVTPLDVVGMVQVMGQVNGSATGAYAVRFENLGFLNSPRAGVFMANSEVGLTNVRVIGSASDGLSVTSAAFVVVNDSEISNNGQAALNVRAGSRAFCTNCSMSGNGTVGTAVAVNVGTNGTATLGNTVITGARGIRVETGTVTANAGQINTTVRALEAFRDGRLVMQNNVLVAGDIRCSLQGSLTAQGMTQTAVTSPGPGLGFNDVSASCTLYAPNGITTFAGPTQIQGMGAAVLQGSAQLHFTTVGCAGGGKIAAPVGTLVSVGGVPGVPASCIP